MRKSILVSVIISSIILAIILFVNLKSEKTYVVTCNFSTGTFVDTIVTNERVWPLKTSYKIKDNHYSTTFCTVRTTINENR
jgi:hypothetical protein